MSQEVLTELVRALDRGEDVALVTIVAAQGSTPQRVGAKMIVFPDGRTIGTIGGRCSRGNPSSFGTISPTTSPWSPD